MKPYLDKLTDEHTNTKVKCDHYVKLTAVIHGRKQYFCVKFLKVQKNAGIKKTMSKIMLEHLKWAHWYFCQDTEYSCSF